MNRRRGPKQSCAVCRHQRRRCDPDCLWWPYFPPERAELFETVRDHYGLCNLIRLLARVKPEEQPQTMETLIAEAEARRKNPVLGSGGFIVKLTASLEAKQKQIESVMQQLKESEQRVQILKEQLFQQELQTVLINNPGIIRMGSDLGFLPPFNELPGSSPIDQMPDHHGQASTPYNAKGKSSGESSRTEK